MKILDLADRSPERSILEMYHEYNPDLILTLGDFHSQALAELKDITQIPKFGIYGNHCSRGYMQELGIFDMHLKIIDYQGFRFGGFEGCVRYKNSATAPMYTQEECTAMMQGFVPVDIFLSHCPPYDINDDHHDPKDLSHVGFTALLDYLEQNSPAHWFHGHTYPPTSQTQYKNTAIHYISGSEIVVLK